MRYAFILSSFLLLLSFNVTATGSADQPLDKPVTDTDGQTFDYDVALKTSQSVVGKQVGNYVFTSASGEKVSLSDFRGKPLIISMVYTSCYQICPMTTRYLSGVVEKARDALGDDSFSAAVIGFDTGVDTPDAMQYFANKQGISDKNWQLLSIDGRDIDALSKDLGFLYYPTSSGFDHLIQATIIDADGKVYRQVYGQVFEPPLLVDPLMELVLGRPRPEQSFITSLGNRIKLFCTTYDPRTGTYFFDYSFFIEIFIGITVIVAISLFMRRELKKSG